ncbi:MAG: DMT family transporter [Gammaproteobacteria bacterium]|nr:DMT family transporter [Gammaproteobacteria bacterium]
MSSNDSRSSLPLLALLFGATLWGVFWYPLRLLEEQGLSGLWLALITNAVAWCVGLPWLWQRRAELKHHPWLLLTLGLVTGLCNITFVLAVIEGNVVRVLLLFYLSPLWASLLGWAALGERLSTRAWALLAVAMAGALIMLWDGAVGTFWPHGRADILALLSGFTFALSNVLIRRLQDVSVPVKTISVWAGGVLVALLWLLFSAQPAPQASSAALVYAIALGALGITAMTLAVQYGVTRMPVQRSAVILLFELVAGALSAAWLAGETVQTHEWLGGALIVLAGYFSARSPAMAERR